MSFHLTRDGTGWRLYEHIADERPPNWTIATFPNAAKHDAVHWSSLILPHAEVEVEDR